MRGQQIQLVVSLEDSKRLDDTPVENVLAAWLTFLGICGDNSKKDVCDGLSYHVPKYRQNAPNTCNQALRPLFGGTHATA